jgi:hypothetical protein
MPPQSVKRKDAGHIGGPIVIPNCVQVRIIFTLSSGKQVFNVMHGQVLSAFAPTAAIANALMSSISSNLTSSGLAALMPTTTSITAIDLRDLRTANQALVASNVAAAPGTSVSPSMPPQNSLVLTLRTALAGRANRGRVYWPGWATNADAGNGSATSAASTALFTLFSNWNSTWAAQGLTMCIGQPHRQHYLGVTGTDHPDRPATTTPLSTFVVRDLIWDTQRRRAQTA